MAFHDADAVAKENQEKQIGSCARCKIHGENNSIRNHRRTCPFLHCQCKACLYVLGRREKAKHYMAKSRMLQQKRGFKLKLPSYADESVDSGIASSSASTSIDEIMMPSPQPLPSASMNTYEASTSAVDVVTSLPRPIPMKPTQPIAPKTPLSPTNARVPLWVSTPSMNASANGFAGERPLFLATDAECSAFSPPTRNSSTSPRPLSSPGSASLNSTPTPGSANGAVSLEQENEQLKSVVKQLYNVLLMHQHIEVVPSA